MDWSHSGQSACICACAILVCQFLTACTAASHIQKADSHRHVTIYHFGVIRFAACSGAWSPVGRMGSLRWVDAVPWPSHISHNIGRWLTDVVTMSFMVGRLQCFLGLKPHIVSFHANRWPCGWFRVPHLVGYCWRCDCLFVHQSPLSCISVLYDEPVHSQRWCYAQ